MSTLPSSDERSSASAWCAVFEAGATPCAVFEAAAARTFVAEDRREGFLAEFLDEEMS